MKKINHKILSLPPYISTSWKNINTLHMKEGNNQSILVVVLHNGSVIEIPHLESQIVRQIFDAHSQFIETEQESQPRIESLKKPDLSLSFGIPFQLDGIENFEDLGSLFQHNPKQATLANLPPEALEKIGALAKAIGISPDQMNLPKAEPHCNCVYCQIIGTLYNKEDGMRNLDDLEEEVSDKDLSFRDWAIEQKGDKLYEITNPLDENERYQIYLGTPIGCTCGQDNCEHIRIVLNS